MPTLPSEYLCPQCVSIHLLINSLFLRFKLAITFFGETFPKNPSSSPCHGSSPTSYYSHLSYPQETIPDCQWTLKPQFSSVQFSSVSQLCLTLCDPMDCSTPGLPVHHQFPEFIQTHVYQVSDAIQPSSVILFSSHLQSFPASESFQMSQFFASGGQRIGVSASALDLPMTIQD